MNNIERTEVYLQDGRLIPVRNFRPSGRGPWPSLLSRYPRSQLVAIVSGKTIAAFADNRYVYPETFIAGIMKLGVTPIPTLLGPSYATLWGEIKRIQRSRNKIMHGQHTGDGINSAQLEADVIHIINWISALAQAADSSFGYDGLRRNTFVAKKKTAKIHVHDYPFTNATELKDWLA